MKEIIVHQEDANSISGEIINIHKENFSFVTKGTSLFKVETSKAIFEYCAQGDGYLVYYFSEGDNIKFNTVVGSIVDSEFEARDLLSMEEKNVEKGTEEVRITEPARILAENKSIDLSELKKEGVITKRDVLNLIGEAEDDNFLDQYSYPDNLKKVVVIGAGYGAHQVIDIFRECNDILVVGLFDDYQTKVKREIMGYKILGNLNRLESLFSDNVFSSAIISVSTDVGYRKDAYDHCVALSIPLVNAIDRRCVIKSNVTFGQGNVICGNSYIGSNTQIGNNNFISAHSSIDHHNVWHSHISTGPNCCTSGLVEIRNSCRLGIGVLFEPNIIVGENSTIASGSIITSSLEANTLIRQKLTVVKSIKE